MIIYIPNIESMNPERVKQLEQRILDIQSELVEAKVAYRVNPSSWNKTMIKTLRESIEEKWGIIKHYEKNWGEVKVR